MQYHAANDAESLTCAFKDRVLWLWEQDYIDPKLMANDLNNTKERGK